MCIYAALALHSGFHLCVSWASAMAVPQGKRLRASLGDLTPSPKLQRVTSRSSRVKATDDTKLTEAAWWDATFNPSWCDAITIEIDVTDQEELKQWAEAYGDNEVDKLDGLVGRWWKVVEVAGSPVWKREKQEGDGGSHDQYMVRVDKGQQGGWYITTNLEAPTDDDSVIGWSKVNDEFPYPVNGIHLPYWSKKANKMVSLTYIEVTHNETIRNRV